MLKGIFRRLGGKTAAANVDTTAQVDALYARASRAWAQGNRAGAEHAARAAIALDPGLPALHYLHRVDRLERPTSPSPPAALLLLVVQVFPP